MSTKIVRKTLSEETRSARMPNGKGSKALTLGIKLRFMVAQMTTKIRWSVRNFMLPMNLTMASLWRSVGVRRSKACSSNLATAAILNCVGLFEMWSDCACFMHGTPDRQNRFSCTRLTTRVSALNLLRTDGADLCRSLRIRRVDNDLDGAPIGIRVRALSFAESQSLELRIIEGEIRDEVISHPHGAGLRQHQVLLRISRRAGGNDHDGDSEFRVGQKRAGRNYFWFFGLAVSTLSKSCLDSKLNVFSGGGCGSSMISFFASSEEFS